MVHKPVILIVLDGWGESASSQGNAIRAAKTPTINKLSSFYPSLLLQASGSSVGLPWGEAGNSEVGHITLGTGRIIYQSMPRITLSIQDGTFFSNEALLTAMTFPEEHSGALHLIGMIGQGSVHSYAEHLYALIEMAKQQKVGRLFLHLFTDGRDSSPTSGIEAVRAVEKHMEDLRIGAIATIGGRNWGMDRNNNWQRVQKAYDSMTAGKGEKIKSASRYLQASYESGVTDEFIEPAVITSPETGAPIGQIRDGDGVIFFNFREDRARELTKAFTLPEFEKFPRQKQMDIEFVTFVEYEKDLPVRVAFAPQSITNTLGETLSKNGKKQLRIAETEKYAHVTYFFNGGVEDPWPGEDRLLVPSPVVSSFDKVPEMNAEKVTESILENTNNHTYDFILANYANADMVGHTGDEAATIRAVEVIDQSLALVIPSVLKKGGALLITADHGNAEEVRNTHTGAINTEHSTNPVPLWYITQTNHRQKRADDIVRQQSEVMGLLSDIAPTILEIMNISKPQEMLGDSLLPLLK